MRNNLLSNWECFVRVNEYNAVTEVGIGRTVDDGYIFAITLKMIPTRVHRKGGIWWRL